ncbi:long-chain-fatty-acid--CoA ligase [Bacteroidales bacterium Barb7]|nr:long-chain-fatty-acid--CoA ligase [Bacteroidales bacterium Barb7]
MEVLIDSPDPRNQAGEILVRGDNLMLGYYKNPEATQAVMQPDGVGEADAGEEGGNVFAQGCAADYYFTAFAAKDGSKLAGDEAEYKLVNKGKFEKVFQGKGLQARKDFVCYNLFEDEGDGEDEGGTYVGKGLGKDGRAGRAGKEMDVTAFVDGVEDFKGKPVHVRHGEHTYYIVGGVNEGELVGGKLRVAPKAAVGYHDAFGGGGCAGGIVEDGEGLGVFDVVVYVGGSQPVGVFAFEAEELVKVGGFIFIIKETDEVKGREEVLINGVP